MVQKEGKKFLILDGHSLAFRAFFALPLELKTKKGLHTNAVLGFTNMLLRLLADESPAYILATFDYPAPTFRHRAYSAYKATREKTPAEMHEQLPLIKEVLQALQIAVCEMEGYEADDLLGTFAQQGEKAGLTTCIVTADADAYQLLSPQVKILVTRRGITKLEELTLEKFKEEYSLTPSQWVDYKALKGDSADNIPGVPGIGKKRALGLLKEYGSLEEVLAHAGKIPGKMGENLSVYAEQARLSKELATICLDIPLNLSLEECRLKEPDWDGLQQVFTQLEFKALANKVAGLARRYQKTAGTATVQEPVVAGKAVQFTLAAGGEEDPGPSPVQEKQSREYRVEPGAAGKNAVIINTVNALQQVIARHRAQGFSNSFSLLLDTGFTRKSAAVKGLACALTAEDVFYIPLSEQQGSKEEAGGEGAKGEERPEITLAAALKILQPLFENPAGRLIAHNLKPLLKHLLSNKINLAGRAFDTQLAAYLLQPERPAYHLDVLFEEYLGFSFPLADKGLSAEETNRQKINFLTLCARHLSELKEILLHNLAARQLKDLLFNLEMPLTHVLAKMELKGIRVREDVMEKLAAEMEESMALLEKDIMELAGEEFNLNSPQQLSYILFEKLGLPVIRRTKTGYSTDARVLQELSVLHPLAAQIIAYRSLAKLKNTYLQGLLPLIDPRTGKIHTTFNQAVTATGRLSSRDPNLQNIPIRLAAGRRLRQAFTPSQPDYLLLAADYSQIELRVMAHLSQDPGLVDAFQKDEDIHTRTAAEVFNISPAEVTPLLRDRAKAVNFGIIYGISDYGLSQDLQISRAEARQYIQSYFARYPGVKKYADECIRLAREKGYVTTLMNRRRYLADINHPNFSRRSVAERAARNTPIQGSAADIIKAAMLAVDRELDKKGLAAAMLLQVHDELIFEVPPAALDEVAHTVKRLMEEIFPLLVRLKVDLKIGRDWYHLEPYALS
ncbi:MAG: DNA polymerase I [Dethiobacteria bacterium]|jgi:DNA polymerase-1